MSEQEGTRRNIQRSRFPSVSLRVAVERAEALHAKEERQTVSREVAVRHWDYTAKSSGGRQTIGALIAFGLLEIPSAGRVRLTDRALTIVMKGSDPSARTQALRDAAVAPEVHRELWEQHKASERPPSEESLIFELHRSLQLSQAAARAAAKEYLDTVDYAKLFNSTTAVDGVNSPPGHAPAKGEQASPGPSALAPPHTSQPPAVGLPPSSGEILRYRLSKECTVDVAFSGPITQSAIDKLRAYLDLSKDAYPETE